MARPANKSLFLKGCFGMGCKLLNYLAVGRGVLRVPKWDGLGTARHPQITPIAQMVKNRDKAQPSSLICEIGAICGCPGAERRSALRGCHFLFASVDDLLYPNRTYVLCHPVVEFLVNVRDDFKNASEKFGHQWEESSRCHFQASKK